MNRILNETSITRGNQIAAVCFFTFLAGLSAGIFFESILSPNDEQYLAYILYGILTSDASTFAAGIFSNVVFLSLILLSGFSVVGIPFSLIVIFTKTFSTGFCCSLLFYIKKQLSSDLLMLPLLLPDMAISLIFCSAAIISISFSLTHQNKNSESDHLQHNFLIIIAGHAMAILAISLLKTIFFPGN